MTSGEFIAKKMAEGLKREDFYHDSVYHECLRTCGDDTYLTYESYKRAVRRVANKVGKMDKIADSIDVGFTLKAKEEDFENNKVTTDLLSKKEYTDLEIKDAKTVKEMAIAAHIDQEKWDVLKTVTNRWGSDDNPMWQLKVYWGPKDYKPTADDYLRMFNEASQAHFNQYQKGWVPPKVKELESNPSDLMLEIAIFDHHFGQLAYKSETRDEDYDLDIAEKLFMDAIEFHLQTVAHKNIGRILLPIGQDFFNADTMVSTTTAGTYQSESGRWKYTFERGHKLLVKAIDRCRIVAPVDVVEVPGNHDEQRSFYLGRFLHAWYREDPLVSVDVGHEKHKLYKWGECLLLITHGDGVRKGALALMFPNIASEAGLWHGTHYREIHKGHLHAGSDKMTEISEEYYSIRERILPSLVPLDDWHAKKAYRALRESVSLLWHKKYGNIAEYKYHPRKEN